MTSDRRKRITSLRDWFTENFSDETLRLCNINATDHKTDCLVKCTKYGRFADTVPCYLLLLRNNLIGYLYLALLFLGLGLKNLLLQKVTRQKQ